MKNLLAGALLLLLLSATNLSAQNKYDMRPQWVSMMEDPNTNYYEAVRVYNEFWKGREKPGGEEEEMANSGNMAARKLTLKRKLTKREQKEKLWEEKMAYEVKRFENWMRETLVFVQEDGRILSMQERIDSWKKQQEESK